MGGAAALSRLRAAGRACAEMRARELLVRRCG